MFASCRLVANQTPEKIRRLVTAFVKKHAPDVEVKTALIEGRVFGNIRALGLIEMKAGAHIEGDVAALSVVMEPGVYFTGRCTMLEHGSESVEMATDPARVREYARE